MRAVLRAAHRAGVTYLTLYAFSMENWKRPHLEVRHLMRLLVRFLRQHEHDLHEHRIRLRVMGCRDKLPETVQRELRRVEAATEGYGSPQLILALSYGGRTEIAHAAREIAREVQARRLRLEQIDEAVVARHLYLPDVPDPDLLIRTSGELRLSNFLLWQSAYTELYFTRTLWPDFREAQFRAALRTYARRHRRFGGLEAPC